MLLPTIVYTGLMLAGAVLLGRGYAAAHGSTAALAAYALKSGWTIQLGTFFELGSAVPLGIFAATLVSRLRFLGVRAAGENIALIGGAGAVVMLFLSALAGWSMSRPGVAENTGAIAVLQSLSFAGGGPGFAVLMGIFVAGASVTAGLYRLVPRWLMGLGIVVALAGELASLTLVSAAAGYCIPVCRFVSVVWMFGMALTLPVTALRSERGAEAAHAA